MSSFRADQAVVRMRHKAATRKAAQPLMLRIAWGLGTVALALVGVALYLVRDQIREMVRFFGSFGRMIGVISDKTAEVTTKVDAVVPQSSNTVVAVVPMHSPYSGMALVLGLFLVALVLVLIGATMLWRRGRH